MATTLSPLTLESVVTRIHAHSLDEASEQLAPSLNVRYVQIERGTACSRGSVAQTGCVTLGHVGADRCKVEWLDVPRDRIITIVPISGRARLGATSVAPGQAILAHGPVQLVTWTDREYRSWFVSMPDRSIDRLAGHIELVRTAQPKTFERCAHRWIVAAETDSSELGASTDALLGVCGAWWREASDSDRALPAPTARCQAAVRARQYIDEHLDRPLTLACVCQFSYSSPRALEYGFREVFGVSPIAYIRCARLSRVRHELFFSPHASGRITQLAMKWGFWHLSQFSKDYYELFGELPSITLGRASGRIDRRSCDCIETAAHVAVAEGL
jgi:AraC-like DNA-binding protein